MNDAGWLLGIDVGGTKTAVLFSRSGFNDRKRREFPTETRLGPQYAIDTIISTAHGMMAEMMIEGSRIAGIGISCGGPLDSKRGIIQSPPNLPGWDNIPIVDLMQQEFGAPARLQNDANACALAEWRYGSGRGSRNFIFLTFGTGMGAGIIAEGRLIEGANGNAGEAGHMRLAPNGPLGYGKPGSFEGFCSGGGIAQIAGEEASALLAKGLTSSFCPNIESIPSITAKDVAIAADAGDRTARRVLKRSGVKLGHGLAILIDLLNPEVIAIGSIFRRCYHHLWPYAERILAEEALPQSLSVCKVCPAELGEEIGDYACLGLAALAYEGS